MINQKAQEFDKEADGRGGRSREVSESKYNVL